jgi:hypothetical protein
MNRRHGLLGLLALGLVAAGHADDAPLRAQSRQIDRFELAGRRLQPGSGPVRSVEFLPQRDGGPLWLALDLLALPGEGGRDEAVFELSLLDVPMQALDTVQIVKGSRMAAVDTARWPRDAKGQLLSQSGLALADVDRQALATALDSGRLRRVVMLRTLTFKDPQPTRLGVGLTRSDGLQPVRLEAYVGQGAAPRELQALADQANGPWWRRYSREAALLGTGVALGGLALWRLRR